MLLFADYDPVSVKDSRFAAVGDGATDDTAALQAALDFCFGPANAPHGTAGVYQNKALWIPAGHYKITAPLTIKYLHGARIVGAGRFVTQIENVTPGSSVFVTNGCGYSRFEGMRLTAASGGKSLDLDWDGSAGGPALQSNTFCRHVLRRWLDRRRDRAFQLHGQREPISQLLLAPMLDRGLTDVEPKRAPADRRRRQFSDLRHGDLCRLRIGSNRPRCRVSAIGAVRHLHGTSARNAMDVAGCRSESTNFINNAGGQKLRVSACSHISASATNGYFLAQAGGHAVLSSCVSTFGALVPTFWAHVRVEECEWIRSDWLQLDPTHLWWTPNNTRTFCLEIENTDYQDNGGNWVEIRRQRLVTLDGQTITTYNYAAN